MAVYFLDTTTLTHLQRKHPRVTVAVRTITQAGNKVGITSVNVEEVIGGWLSLLRRARTNTQEAFASANLAEASMFIGRFPVASVTEKALDRFDHLVRLTLNVGKMDLKIAAIALELDATVVSDNVIDFGRVPNLKWEDWTK